MIVTGGATDITTYFAMRLEAGGDATGLTIADFDLQYVRTRTAPVAKVDAVALAATDTAHTDNRGIEIDATDQPGLYRFDWPDAAFAAGVKEVILTVKHTSCLTEHLRVEIDPFGAPAGASLAADVAAIKTETASILDDTDLIDDGTSGLVKIAQDVAAVLVDTAVIGAAGAGLTDLGGMSTTMKAQVNAEADTALADYDPPTNTEMVAAFTEIKGATWATTDTLEAIRDRGDAAWVTATSVTVSDKTGFKLASDGLDLVTAWTVAITGNVTGNLSGSVGSVTGAVGSVTGLTASDVGAIKTQTDSLTFTVAGEINANTRYVKGQEITGAGTEADPWGPV